MATPGGPDDFTVELAALDFNRYEAVKDLLHQTPQEFNFFQAVRLLERLLPDRAPIGRFVSPSKEVVRFAAHASFPFPASQIQNILWPEEPGGMPTMVINFMGLVGPSGVMPLYYTGMIVERVRQKDTAIRDFLDMFNHRMVSLFYQAWEKYRFAVAFERREMDRFSHHLQDLIGMGTKGLEHRLAVRDHSLLFYSGLLSMHTRSAAALQRILADYFSVPVEIEQFVGAWHSLDEPDLCRFEYESPSEQLGMGVIVGDEIYNQQSGVRIKLGPMGLEQYLDFLPSGTAHQPLKSFANFIARGDIDFEVQLILKKEEVPECELGLGDSPVPRLGWTSWAKTAPKLRDASDTIFSI
jgi:type VI secretion system protein ImpH